MFSMMKHSCGKFHINKVLFGADTVLWVYRHWLLSLSETKGGQTVRAKGLRVYLTVNSSVFARWVYICDMIQYMQFIVSCTHTNAQVFTVKTEVTWGLWPKSSRCCHTRHRKPRVACCPTYECRCLQAINKHIQYGCSSLKGTTEDPSHVGVTMSQMLLSLNPL